MHPATGYQGEESSTSLSRSSPQEAGENNEATPQTPSLQIKANPGCSAALHRTGFQPPPQLTCSPLEAFKNFHVPLKLHTALTNTESPVWTRCWCCHSCTPGCCLPYWQPGADAPHWAGCSFPWWHLWRKKSLSPLEYQDDLIWHVCGCIYKKITAFKQRYGNCFYQCHQHPQQICLVLAHSIRFWYDCLHSRHHINTVSMPQVFINNTLSQILHIGKQLCWKG